MSISNSDAVRELWHRGKLDYKRHSGQLSIKKYIEEDDRDIIPILAARRLGKSFELILEIVEMCVTNSNTIVKYVCPRLKQVKQVVNDNMRVILEDCPPDLQPEWKENDKMYIFPNGSQIQFAGTDNGSHENLRGGKAHLCVVDEAGFCDHLDYVINSVLAPTVDTTDGKIILVSTPSKFASHEFIVNFIKPAMASGNLLKLTIHDNPMLTDDKKAKIAARFPNGIDNPQYRREYLCEIINDVESMVIGEFTESKQKELVKNWPIPAYYDAYTSGDVGFKDLTVYLFAYWDFINATLVIEDELVMNGPTMTTKALANEIKRKEAELFKDGAGEALPIYLRVMDNNLIMVNDLQRLHGLNFMATAKDNKEAQINQVKIMISNNQIIINPKCVHLIYHLANATWNKNHTEFSRLADTPDNKIRGGHADAVDALIYLVRNLIRSKNPYPPNWGRTMGEGIFQSQLPSTENEELVSTFKRIFNIKSD